jgi:hypothetical protein
MSHLQLPKNPLGKRKSDEDLGRDRVQEKKDFKVDEDRKKANYVHRKPRMRVKQYCCTCQEIRKFLGHICLTCEHKSCCECLAHL